MVRKLNFENCVVVKSVHRSANMRENELEFVLQGQGEGGKEAIVVGSLKKGGCGGDGVWEKRKSDVEGGGVGMLNDESGQ